MCFVIDVKHPEKKIAKKDIICYKRLDIKFRSPYRVKLYKLNKLYKSELIKDSLYCIYVGIHSYSCKKEAKHQKWSDEIIVKGIIPKGSEYYYNPNRHEYVSNQIIIQEVIK